MEGCLPLAALSNADQMVDVAKVQLRENGGSLEPLKGSRDEGHKGHRIMVLYDNIVRAALVDAESQRLILLFHEEEPPQQVRKRGRDDPCCQGVIEISMAFLSGADREYSRPLGAG